REPGQFHPRHIAGSQNAPEAQTTALVRKLQTVDRAVLICNDGKLSSLVARTLGLCKVQSVVYLEGGIDAWKAAGGRLVETTRSGFEHELPDKPLDGEKAPQGSAPARWLRSIKNFFGSSGDEDDQ